MIIICAFSRCLRLIMTSRRFLDSPLYAKRYVTLGVDRNGCQLFTLHLIASTFDSKISKALIAYLYGRDITIQNFMEEWWVQLIPRVPEYLHNYAETKMDAYTWNLHKAYELVPFINADLSCLEFHVCNGRDNGWDDVLIGVHVVARMYDEKILSCQGHVYWTKNQLVHMRKLPFHKDFDLHLFRCMRILGMVEWSEVTVSRIRCRLRRNFTINREIVERLKQITHKFSSPSIQSGPPLKKRKID